MDKAFRLWIFESPEPAVLLLNKGFPESLRTRVFSSQLVNSAADGVKFWTAPHVCSFQTWLKEPPRSGCFVLVVESSSSRLP